MAGVDLFRGFGAAQAKVARCLDVAGVAVVVDVVGLQLVGAIDDGDVAVEDEVVVVVGDVLLLGRDVFCLAEGI